jgi:hypothetical protein
MEMSFIFSCSSGMWRNKGHPICRSWIEMPFGDRKTEIGNLYPWQNPGVIVFMARWLAAWTFDQRNAPVRQVDLARISQMRVVSDNCAW